MAALAEETGDDSWTEGFKVAYGLHLNFYNDNMLVPVLEANRMVVRAFVGKILVSVDEGEGHCQA